MKRVLAGIAAAAVAAGLLALATLGVLVSRNLPDLSFPKIPGFSRVAEAAVPLLPASERAELAALTDGINAFIDTRAGRWGLEFTRLRPVPGLGDAAPPSALGFGAAGDPDEIAGSNGWARAFSSRAPFAGSSASGPSRRGASLPTSASRSTASSTSRGRTTRRSAAPVSARRPRS
jgi:hypothetical protein